jgi:hypothetical protein
MKWHEVSHRRRCGSARRCTGGSSSSAPVGSVGWSVEREGAQSGEVAVDALEEGCAGGHVGQFGLVPRRPLAHPAILLGRQVRRVVLQHDGERTSGASQMILALAAVRPSRVAGVRGFGPLNSLPIPVRGVSRDTPPPSALCLREPAAPRTDAAHPPYAPQRSGLLRLLPGSVRGRHCPPEPCAVSTRSPSAVAQRVRPNWAICAPRASSWLNAGKQIVGARERLRSGRRAFATAGP